MGLARRQRSMSKYELALDKATKRTGKSGHGYFWFPDPQTHENYTNRPTVYPTSGLDKYKGAGSNGGAKLLPSIFTEVNQLMTELLDYGKKIGDWSIQSAVVQNGWRPDDISQGEQYLRIIKERIASEPKTFGDLKFPADLEEMAKSDLGRPGDPKREEFHQKLIHSPRWSADLDRKLFEYVDKYYAPRGFNPHATGLVFDLDFKVITEHGNEYQVGANPGWNSTALRNAVGMWLNMYSMQFHFDSYDTGAEIWHMEYRKP
jgi:hypothetical protein